MIIVKDKIPGFHLSVFGIFRCVILPTFLSGVTSVNCAAAPDLLTEEGYLGELPVVLSVTRLAQSLADTPAAVTIIDRDIIRRSGARRVSELLRLVPGFLVSGWNGGNDIVQYHAKLDETGSRLQVFIDGRSVYSSLNSGGSSRSLSALVMEDIERIEVLRGSNSAAHGANAFLGVINIVTRNSADTHGTMLSVTRGDHGISDQVIRHGWGSAEASYRITASRRADNGYEMVKAFPTTNPLPSDNNALNQMNFRGDLRPSNTDEVQFMVGGSKHSTDEGDGTVGNRPRTAYNNSAYAQVRFNRQLSDVESVSMSGSFDEEEYKDTFLYGNPALPAMVDTGGKGRRYQFELSKTRQHDSTLRSVWGVSWREDSAQSKPLFNRSDWLTTRMARLFGNVEWRFSPQWLLNVGGMFENHSHIGSNLAPRVMLNFQPHPEHTLRVGTTRATRAPSLFESFGDTRFFNINTGALLANTTKASGNADAETITSFELGYLGEFRSLGLTADVRAFDEKLEGLLSRRQTGPSALFARNDYFNVIDYKIHGVEYQLNWRPNTGTRILFSQARTHIKSDDQQDFNFRAPRNSYSVAWFQALPGQFDFGLIHTYLSSTSFRGISEMLPSQGTTDIRLARAFRIGATRAEFSVTTQSVSGSYYGFITPTSSLPIVPLIPRRTFATLRLEF